MLMIKKVRYIFNDTLNIHAQQFTIGRRGIMASYGRLRFHIIVTALFAVRISAENGKTFNKFLLRIFQQMMVHPSDPVMFL